MVQHVLVLVIVTAQLHIIVHQLLHGLELFIKLNHYVAHQKTLYVVNRVMLEFDVVALELLDGFLMQILKAVKHLNTMGVKVVVNF